MKNILKKWEMARDIFPKSDGIRIFLFFSFFVALISVMYLSVNSFPSTDDPFFHIRFAEMIRDKGFQVFENFPWLYFSKIAQNQTYFIYYNFIFYLFLIPFTVVDPLMLGIKLYGIVGFSLGFTVIYGFLLKIKEKNPFFWITFLFAVINAGLFWRFFMARPFTLTPALVILELYFLYKKKYWWVFFISFLYLYWHSVTFFFPIVVGAVFFIFQTFYQGNKKEWKNLWVPIAGVLLAFLASLVFAGGFYYFIKDIYIKLFQETILGGRVNIAEGNELYPVEPLSYIRENASLFFLLIVAFVFEVVRYVRGKLDEKMFESFKEKGNTEALRVSLFFLTAGFLLGTFLSRRNGDFFIVCALVYLPMAYNLLLGEINFKNFFSRLTFAIGATLITIFFFASNLILLQEQISRGAPYQLMERAAAWLKSNTAPGSVVFHTTWNWFPALFYYDTQNYYIAGIEPRFLYDYQSDLYWKWRNISEKGLVCPEERCLDMENEKTQMMRHDEKREIWYNKTGNEVADSVEKDFQSTVIVTSSDFSQLNELMDHSPRFKKVFSDGVYPIFIYQIQKL